MQPTHVILRPISGGGAQRVPGEAIDARSWRHVEYFCETRRLRPLMAGEETIACDCGRYWTDADRAVGHCRKAPEPELLADDRPRRRREQAPA